MQLNKFYLTVGQNEESATTFLREFKLLDTANEILPCHKCGNEMANARKRDCRNDFRPVLRCQKRVSDHGQCTTGE